MDLADIPHLEGWVALTDAARELGITRQGIHKLVRSGAVRTIHKIGPVPVYVMTRQELDDLKVEREARSNPLQG